MSGSFRRLTEEDVVVGQPLKFSVHDESEILLLRRGFIVSSEQQRKRLLNQKVFISIDEELKTLDAKKKAKEKLTEKTTISVFEWVDNHYQMLSDIYIHFNDPEAQSRKKLQLIAERIYRISEKHSDGLLAACQLAQGKIYSHIKALHVGLLCEALGRRAGLPTSQRLPLIAAGLTHDIGMWKLQEEIRDRKEPLTDEQWQHIRSHTDEGKAMLKAIGVTDKLWLETLGQHHERLNGSGYPKGLKDKQVLQTARILAITDTFAAMIKPRGDRGQRMPKEAMRDLFLSRGEEIDATMAQLFIKELGLFSPGSIVRLVTGEVGVVTGAGNNASSPDVEVIIDAAGNHLKRSAFRDTTQKNYAVAEMVERPDHPDLDKLLSNMWSQVPRRS